MSLGRNDPLNAKKSDWRDSNHTLCWYLKSKDKYELLWALGRTDRSLKKKGNHLNKITFFKSPEYNGAVH